MSSFIGEVDVRWLSHDGADRNMMLLAPFEFVGSNGLRWKVPAHAVINGASIPQVFWTTFGSPFIGDYRRASVVHDHYCATRERTSHETHRMFHEACLAGGVPSSRAGAMYLAVRTFGPSWARFSGALSLPGLERRESGETIPVVGSMDLNEFHVLRQWIERDDPTVEEIDARADRQTTVYPALPVAVEGF